MNKIAVVFGASGLVGKQLVFELLEDERFYKIIIVARQKLPISNSKLEQYIVDDFLKLHQYANQLNGDTYFCCIGTTIKKAGSKPSFEKVDLDIPVIIATLASKLNIQNLVIISSVGANHNSSNFYLQAKGKMEQQVSDVYHNNLKFVRPSFLVGNRFEFRLSEKLAAILMPFLSIFMLGSSRKFKAIEADDVARAMINSIELPKEQKVIEYDSLILLSSKTKRPKVKKW